MKVVSVIGIKGGSGKTSAAVPLAYYASNSGKTLLVDLDPQPSAYRWMKTAQLDAIEDLDAMRSEGDLLEGVLDRARADLTDWVFVDTPSVMRDVALQAAFQADLILVPMHIGSGDMDNLVETIRLSALPLRMRPQTKMLVVLNHTGNMPAITRRTRTMVETHAGLPVARTEIPFRSIYAEAKGYLPTGEHYAELFTEVQEVLA